MNTPDWCRPDCEFRSHCHPPVCAIAVPTHTGPVDPPAMAHAATVNGDVLTIKLEGRIHPGDGERMAKWVLWAAKAPEIRGIFLEINSGGGDAKATDALEGMIHLCKHAVPIVGWATRALSGAFQVGVSCSKLFADRWNTPLGSVGSVSTICFQGDVRLFAYPPGKATGGACNKPTAVDLPPTKENVDAYARHIREHAEAFRRTVLMHRPCADQNWLLGDDWNADVTVAGNALEHGLIDDVCDNNFAWTTLRNLINGNPEAPAFGRSFRKDGYY